MRGSCRFSLDGSSGEAAWSYDGVSLVVTPESGMALVFALRDLCGVSGDDYSVTVVMPGAHGLVELTLSHLGHDGPTLAEALRRDWLGVRTEVLRLTGSGEAWLVRGQVSGLDAETSVSGAPEETKPGAEPFWGCLYEDVLVIAREGRDLEPLFLGLVDSFSFDEASYSVRVEEWPGREIVFAKLAKQTDDLVGRLGRARAALAGETAATLASALPGLPVGARTVLAGTWLPGRLLEMSSIESLCPGFEQAFRSSWLAGSLRGEEAGYLLQKASPARTWLGCTREAGDVGPAAQTEGGQDGQAAPVRPLWVLAAAKGAWFLEPLSIEDHATYCFRGGEEMPALVSKLLCAPQFSKEALYSPLTELTGDKSELAIPATYLTFLAQLRSRFTGRIIHRSVESWKKEVDQAG